MNDRQPGEPGIAPKPVSDALLVERSGPVLWVTFNRPEQRNAMTWSMYDGLLGACREADDDPGLRALVLRGAGGQSFVAGTDIAQFGEFEGGAAGVEYERRMTALIDRVGAVSVPTVAVVTGFCVGAGLALAAACDLRIASRPSVFGVPIARTLGNCLSAATTSLLVSHFGLGRTLDLLLRARMMTAQEAYAAGFLSELCGPDEIDATATALVDRLVEHAPLTMWAAKEAVRRLRTSTRPDDADILDRVYGSEDFRAGVRAFMAKERPAWKGR
ncbi:MAG TPA: enoyl-CoA hydratase/isomerase family protein [Actinopolymorphaceae bacterium]|nr:enoyl-CoA hydratase/isomerase family protein [Actinopolymorphaceae bacterium]